MKLVRSVQYWSTLLHSTLTILVPLLTSPVVLAQGIQAHVRSVTGIANLSDKTRPGIFPIKRKDQLEPGSTIETGYNGHVVIRLSDDSQVTVLPNSKVVLKDYPSAHSARELLDILLGRVLVKIHHIGGKPNPYRLNSPSASIAVRGTEFIVDVLPNGETLVAVREGQVEVWPHSNPGNKRLITPGGSVIVRPGGDISRAFPGPGSELNGRTRVVGFNRDLSGAYNHSVNSLIQNSINILPVFLSAFPDPHLDGLENPACAAEFKDAEGRISLLPSVSRPYFIDELNRLDYTISPQLTFYTPIPGSRLTVGGSVSTLRTKLQTLTAYQSPGENNYSYYNNNDLRFSAYNTSLIAAYSLGAQGRTSAGIGIDNLSGDGSYLYEDLIKSNGYTSEYRDISNVRFGRTRLTFGLFHKFSDSKKIGIYYRHGINSSNQESQTHRNYENINDPDYLSHSSQAGEANISTVSSEAGVRFRARMTRRLFYGLEGSYLYERIKSRYTRTNQPQFNERDLARRARLGVGTGFVINPRILLSFDFTGGLFNTTKPTDNRIFINYYRYPEYPVESFLDSTVQTERGTFLSAHAMIQANPWRNLFVSAASLSTARKDQRIYGSTGYSFKDREASYLTNIGTGWRFKSNFIAEYLFSIDHTSRRPSHSLILRYTFSLNITEK